MPNTMSVEVITTKILLIRGRGVMLDRDLAELYRVSTKALNQSKEEHKTFPSRFYVSVNR